MAMLKLFSIAPRPLIPDPRPCPAVGRLPREAVGSVGALLATVALLAGCAPSGGFKITPIPADRTLQTSVVDREAAFAPKIALVEIEGVLANEVGSDLFSVGPEDENPVSFAVEKLDAAAADPAVRAIILRINSPGGTVSASDLLYQEVRRFRERTGKPVIAVLMDVAASGGYYVACAAEEIIAQRSTVTGSIGVIMQRFSLEGTLKKVGVKAEAIASGPMKEAGSPWRDMTGEERALFESLVRGHFERFLDVVAAGRPGLDRARIEKLADGRPYSAAEALEHGLIDRIGTLRDGLSAAKAKADLKQANTIVYKRPLSWKPNPYATGAGPISASEKALSAERLIKDWTGGVRFLYLGYVQ